MIPTTTDVAAPVVDAALLETVLLRGDLGAMKAPERMNYYPAVCNSLGLNPLTRPFDFLSLQGKTVLYAKRECTEQLRKIHGVSVTIVDRSIVDDVYIVTARAKDKSGREDESTGAVLIGGLKGENKANAFMKAETKAKRRVTLSICGLAFLDETEADSVPGAGRLMVDMETGEIVGQDGGSKEASEQMAAAKIQRLSGADDIPPVATASMQPNSGAPEQEPGGSTPRKGKSKVTAEQIDFLPHYKQVKHDLFIASGKHVEYYDVLQKYGFEHANDIRDKDRARSIYKELCGRLNDLRLGITEADIQQPEKGGTD